MKPKPLSAFDKNDLKKPTFLTSGVVNGGVGEIHDHDQKRNFLSYLRSKLDSLPAPANKRCFHYH